MLVAVVPLKRLHLAKRRLAQVLGATERRALALAMLGDVLSALRAARVVARAIVISPDDAVLEQAVELGAEALLDQAADLNGALAQAASHSVALGAEALLVLPADLPLITPAEIDRLSAALDGASGVVLTPSRDGGTNALLARPPQALPFRFGPHSLARHIEAARARGIAPHIVRSPGLELDIDRPTDLLLLSRMPGASATQRLLRGQEIAVRVGDRR